MTRLAIRSLLAAALGLASVGAPIAASPSVAGDAQVAETLFKSGKQALAKGDWAGASTFFTRAEEEMPELIEARWWRASAKEKAGDKPGALALYREYLLLLEAKVGSGAAPSKEEQRLRGLAEKSVDALAAGDKEIRKLEDAYVAALLAFAKDRFVRDPGISATAVESLLVVKPDHEEALRLREKLSGAPPSEPAAGKPQEKPSAATGPFAAVKEWKDLLAEQSLKSAEHIQYADGLLIFETKQSGASIACTGYLELGPSYAYEMEFRVLETYRKDWLTGITFAGDGLEAHFLCAEVEGPRISLMRATSRDSLVDVAKAEQALDTKGWHRVGVIVKGPSVDLWFDGRKVISWKDPSATKLDGVLGVFQQYCRTEQRLYRVGRLE